MVIEVVHGTSLEKRAKQFLDIKPQKVTLRMTSQHVLEFQLGGMSFYKKIKRLLCTGRVVLLVNLDRYKTQKPVQKAVDELEELGVTVKLIKNLHAKIFLIDSSSEKGFLITSANLSHQAFHVNKEIGIYQMNDSDQLFKSVNNYILSIMKRKYQR